MLKKLGLIGLHVFMAIVIITVAWGIWQTVPVVTSAFGKWAGIAFRVFSTALAWWSIWFAIRAWRLFCDPVVRITHVNHHGRADEKQ